MATKYGNKESCTIYLTEDLATKLDEFRGDKPRTQVLVTMLKDYLGVE
jgi:hypothetical protein